MLIINSLEKMKGQVFQKHTCVCLEHEEYSPGVNGIIICTNTWGHLTCRLVLSTVHTHVMCDADHLQSKANSIFLGNML